MFVPKTLSFVFLHFLQEKRRRPQFNHEIIFNSYADELELEERRLKLRPLRGDREGEREDDDLPLRRGERERDGDFLRLPGGLYERGGDLLPGPSGDDLLLIGDRLPGGDRLAGDRRMGDLLGGDLRGGERRGGERRPGDLRGGDRLHDGRRRGGLDLR